MRIRFLLNIVLTFIWVAITGEFNWINAVFGFLASFFIILLIGQDEKSTKYGKFLPNIIGFVFFFSKELVMANIQVAMDVVTPKLYLKPGIVKVPLDVKGDFEISLLANLLTLTPGSLTVDISSDKKAMFVHGMYINNEEEFINSIKNGFEKRIIKTFS